MGSLHFTKHHGCGNDFLVTLQTVQTTPLGADEVRALCDRHRGVGADGLIVGTPGSDGADLEMLLRNADGSNAEMSGNGIRCLVQAAVAAGMTNEGPVVVDTGAGRRRVEYRVVAEGLGYAEVDMGAVLVGEDLPLGQVPVVLAGPSMVARACAVNVGNPHLVLLAANHGPDLSAVGPMIESAVVGGVNVEVVRVRNGTALDIEVWERGVGMTESCGTGACAAAGAAISWGLVGDRLDPERDGPARDGQDKDRQDKDGIEVRSGGGALRVKLGPRSATLCGPARLVGEFTVKRDLLSGLVAERRDEVVAAL